MKNAKILLVEDDASVSHVISTALKAEGFTVETCISVTERDRCLANVKYNLLISDIGLGSEDGLDSLHNVRSIDPDIPIIIISAQNSLSTAVRASESKVFEYFPKPFDLDELVKASQQALRPNITSGLTKKFDSEELPLVGRSAAMQSVYRMITRLLNNELSVLILGESGTGKELVAEAIHTLGHRKLGPFVAVNMAAIPVDLIESELFGYEKGAFTGAVKINIGKFELAQDGTLFLDEIGDMPMHAQTRLLRALQSETITRLGGNKVIKLNVRIIAATNQNLEELVASGKFREDLYYRLNVVPIELPPLRERREDIPALTNHFFKQAMSEGLPSKAISNAGMDIIYAQEWRGNVRELRNFIYRLIVTAREDQIDEDAIRQCIKKDKISSNYKIVDTNLTDMIQALVAELIFADKNREDIYEKISIKFERPLFKEAIRLAAGNQIKAAKLLGINRNTLRKKLIAFDIKPESRTTKKANR